MQDCVDDLDAITIERNHFALALANGHRFLSALTSFGIGTANITILKIMPGPTGVLEVAAYLLGGPLGILTSMSIHPWMARKFGRKS